jgi:hypothetical protein
MSEGTCECLCLGCRSCPLGEAPAEGQDAHHTRLLLALDLSIAAACRSRGVAACNGIDDSEPCEVGSLHTRTAALAIALAAAIEQPSDGVLVERATSSLEALLAEFARTITGKAMVS